MKELIFVSSVQKELAAERRAVADFVRGHVLLRRFFEVFLFEELPATDRRADDLYLEKVDEAAIYLGLFGREYGAGGPSGVSATEREYEQATEKGKPRLIFVKAAAGKTRHPKMARLIRRAEGQLVRGRFDTISDLTAALLASLVDHLARTGVLREKPLPAVACPDASWNDLAREKIASFLRAARQARRLALKPTASPEETMTHLNLLDGAKLTYSAVLLFGTNPQRFLPAAQVKCLHFHGTEVRKPIPSYQLFEGSVFEQVDEAVDFVLAKLAQSVGLRDQGPQAPVAYDLPPPAVEEAIVNAVAHRDYTSPAGVQVHVFSDRVEVWNPGDLPPSLTAKDLREPHPSIPRNPLIANALYRARYIEQAGTGTLDMIAACRQAGLPEPDFEQRGGQFVVTLWRDWVTPGALATIELTVRQRRAVDHVKTHRRIANREYQELFGVSKPTATRDLEDLAGKGLLARVGSTGKGTYYVLSREGLRKGSKGSAPPKGSERAQRPRTTGRPETRQKPDKPHTIRSGVKGAAKGPATRRRSEGDKKGPKGT